MTDRPTHHFAEKLDSLLKRTRGIIWDFDGLLADSEPYHYKAYNEVFQRYGHTLDPGEYWVEWTSKGKGIQGEIERHNLNLQVEPAELRRQKFEVYSQYCQSGTIKLFPQTRPLAESLNATHQTAIASGSWAHDIRSILENENALTLFPLIFGKESATREKPHPDIFLRAAKSMDLKAGECLVVEDALKGLYASQKAGMPCLIIRNRLNENINFEEAGLVLPSLEQFLSLLSPAR